MTASTPRTPGDCRRERAKRQDRHRGRKGREGEKGTGWDGMGRGKRRSKLGWVRRYGLGWAGQEDGLQHTQSSPVAILDGTLCLFCISIYFMMTSAVEVANRFSTLALSR